MMLLHHHISYIIYHISYVICHMSYVICHMSYVIYHMSYIVYRISYIVYRISYIIYRISYIVYRILYRISYIVYHISYIMYRISYIIYRISIIIYYYYNIGPSVGRSVSYHSTLSFSFFQFSARSAYRQMEIRPEFVFRCRNFSNRLQEVMREHTWTFVTAGTLSSFCWVRKCSLSLAAKKTVCWKYLSSWNGKALIPERFDNISGIIGGDLDTYVLCII